MFYMYVYMYVFYIYICGMCFYTQDIFKRVKKNLALDNFSEFFPNPKKSNFL